MDAEGWFWRIHSEADDYGNFHANPQLVFQATTGLRETLGPNGTGKKITVKMVEIWINEMYDAGMLALYIVEEEKFLHLHLFEDWQPPMSRNGKRVQRFPRPPADQCVQVRCKAVQSGASKENQTIQADQDHKYDQDQDQNKDQKNITRALQARIVFGLWQKVTNHPGSEFDDKRRQKVNARLRDGFTIERLHKCFIGYTLDPFHMGKNERSKPGHLHKFDDLSLMCRDAHHVEKGLGWYTQKYGEIYPPPIDIGAMPEAAFNSDLAAFVSEQCMAGIGSPEVLALVSEKFGVEHCEAASRIIEFYDQAKADMQ